MWYRTPTTGFIGWTHPPTVDGPGTRGPSSSPSAARSRTDTWLQHGFTERVRVAGDTLCLLDGVEIARAQCVPPIRWSGRPTVDRVFRDSGKAIRALIAYA